MPALLLRAQRVSFSFNDAVAVLTDAEFHLSPGWTGLVGANGAGKSTLLGLLAGELTPTQGTLQIEPPSALVRACPQSVESLTPEIRALAEAGAGTARRVVGQLRLDPGELDRWSTLSPGERKRWQVGAALASDPDVLLLDEPTNHLDAEARGWLVTALRRFRGIGLVVSHDRSVLEALTTRTLRIHGGTVRLWPGAYEAARREWEAELQARQDARDQARGEQQRQDRRLAQARRDQEAATAQRSSRRRMKDRNDHDARSIGAQNRVAWAEDRLGRNVGVMRRGAERATEALESIAMEKALGRSVFVDYERSPKPWIFVLEAPSLRLGGVEVLGPLSVSVARDSRIWVEGPNGAGKTTLLKALLDQARVPSERVLYLPQDVETAQAAAVLDEVRGLPEAERGRVLSIVAALGVDPERLLASERPSPGEVRKLVMAHGLGSHAWALVLDEPTNHLDLPSIERLEEALTAYPGALLLVTHDEHFARRCTSTRWRVAGGRVEVGLQLEREPSPT